MAVFLRLLRTKWNPEPVPTTSFAGKTVIVTGSNVGLGLEAAKHFYRLDCARLILAVRSVAKGEAAQREIEETTTRSASGQGVIQVWLVDMASFSSVRAFASRVNTELDKVDVVLLNAGLYSKEFGQSPEGWESHLQVNTISTALLACLLLPNLKASRRVDNIPHLGIVASSTHMFPSFPQQNESNILKALNTPSAFTQKGQRTYYAISKLFVMYIVSQLSLRTLRSEFPTPEPDVIITSTCPGLCRSDLARDYNAWYISLPKDIFFFLFARTTEEGARTLVHSVSMGPEIHGGCWRGEQLLKPGPLVGTEDGKKLEAKVWAEIGEVLKATDPSVAEWFS